MIAPVAPAATAATPFKGAYETWGLHVDFDGTQLERERATAHLANAVGSFKDSEPRVWVAEKTYEFTYEGEHTMVHRLEWEGVADRFA